MFYVYIKCDTNDGDYVAKLSLIKDDEDFMDLTFLAEAIRKRGPRYGTVHDFAASEYHDEHYTDQYPQLNPEMMSNLVNTYFPGSENGFHSIDEFKLLAVSEIDDLLKGDE